MTAWSNLPPALPPHGTVLAWVRGCRCDECEPEYQRFMSELALRGPPVRGLLQELYGRGQAVEVRLELLPAEAVTAYVTARLGGQSRPRSRRSSWSARRAMRCFW